MDQPVDPAPSADNQAAHQVVQDDAGRQPRQPGTHAQESPETEGLWTLFQVDQQRISALDTTMMTIRGWTVTVVSALVGFSLSQHHRDLLPVAMVGTVLFALLDVRYRRTQMLHADRSYKVEQAVVPSYPLRPDGYHQAPQWLSFLPKRLYFPSNRLYSSISFYVVVVFLLLLLWIVT
jgi:uncharacterized membrane protein